MGRKVIGHVDKIHNKKDTCDMCGKKDGFTHIVEDGYMDVYECINCGHIHYW